MFKEISPEEAYAMLQQNSEIKFFDVRKSEDFDLVHPQGAKLFDYDVAQEFSSTAEYDTPVIFICYIGLSSKKSAAYLLELGFDEVYSVIGGMESWQKKGLPVEARL